MQKQLIRIIKYGFLIQLFTVMTCSVSLASSKNIPNDLKPGLKFIRESTLKENLSFLAQDKLKGRFPLTPGDDEAIRWIAKLFKEAGLKPVANGQYLQPVPLIEFTPDKKNSYIVVNRAGKITKWKKPNAIIPFSDNIDLNGEVVFAGYGITAKKLNYDDYQNIDVRHKIVLVFEHEPDEKNPASVFNGIANTPYATPTVKILNAQKHGAIAVLIAPEPNRKHPSNLERYMRVKGINPSMPSQVLADDKIHIPYVMISDKVANLIAGNQSLSTLQTKIDRTLKTQSQVFSTTHVTIHNKIKLRKMGTSYNVVGLLEGNDPSLKKETIIISAHHDHDGSDGKRIWRGADDNASGTVGVVTLARAMSANAKLALKPKRSILFVVFTAEERGLLGAFYMAAHPLRPLATTRALINFDMIGRNEAPTEQTDGLINIPKNTQNRLNLIGAHYSPDYNKTVEHQNQYVGLILDHRFDNDSALNIFFRSDQFPFVLRNIPAFWWFTGFHPDYHQTTDTADKINYSKMVKILTLSYLSAFAFANESSPPKFITYPK